MPLTAELEALKSANTRSAHVINQLELRLDDAENRSRRNNLIFYGLADPSAKETYAESEKLVIGHCRDNLEMAVDPKEIERAHRLGRHDPNRPRPIIVKFSSFKTKDAILSQGPKFKGTNYSVGEDFSRRVQYARKQLVAFAKAKDVPFFLRYKTLFIDSKRYVFDEASQEVKALS